MRQSRHSPPRGSSYASRTRFPTRHTGPAPSGRTELLDTVVSPTGCRMLVSLLAAAAVSPGLFPLIAWARRRGLDGRAGAASVAVSVRGSAVGSTAGIVAAGLGLAALSAVHQPVSAWPAWWLYSQAGTALAVIDLREHRLPKRLTYPLAGAEFAALTAAAATTSDGWTRLLRAFLAAAGVGVCWLVAALAAPGGLGLGDVKLAAIAAAPLGWTSWILVLDAQLVIFLLALLTAAVLAIAKPSARSRRMAVPLGPALVLGALLTGLL